MKWTKFGHQKQELILTEEKTNFEKAAECRICKNPFEDGEKKVRDHCHYSGKFRGAAHNQYNLLFRKPKHVPVTFITLLDMIHIYSSIVLGKHKVILIVVQTMKKTT